jgi:hypothetical protein
MEKLTPEETLKALETFDEATGDAEMDRVLAMTPEERDAELRAGGFDPAEVDAKSDALYAELTGRGAPAVAEAQLLAPPEPASRRVAPGRRRVVAWTVVAACAATVALVLAGAHYLGTKSDIVVRPEPPERSVPQPPRLTAEQELRQAAAEACGGELWGRCQNKLDEAAKLDPAGESTPQVRELRKAIEAHTAHGDDKGKVK